MVEDLSIECDGPERAAWISYAAACVAVYPIGIPLLFAVLLWHRRFELCPSARGKATSHFFVKQAEWFTEKESAALAAGSSAEARSVAFLASAYSPHCCWFEVYECLRRLLLSSVLNILPDSYVRAVVALLLCVLGIRVSNYYQPFEQDFDDVIYEIGQWALFATFLAALVFQVQDAASEAGASPDALDARVASSLLIAVNVFSFSLGIFLLGIDVRKFRKMVAAVNPGEGNDRGGGDEAFAFEMTKRTSGTLSAGVSVAAPPQPPAGGGGGGGGETNPLRRSEEATIGGIIHVT